MGKQKTFTARHILEIRHTKKTFNFLDYYGELVDHLLNTTGFDKIKVEKSGARVEVVSDNLDETYFFSFENFGFQIEAKDDFQSFNDTTIKILKIIEDFPKYRLRDVIRIGTKSTVFCNIPSRSEDGIKQLFFNKLFANKDRFESNTGLKVEDIAFLYLDTKNDGIQSHITTGPSNLEEVIARYLPKVDLYLPFGKKSGVFYEIDAYSENLEDVTLEKIKSQVEKQIALIEKSFTGYMSLFNDKTK